MHYFLQQKICV